VFVRHDALRSPLQPPYDGPYRVLERKDKCYVLDLAGRQDTVSIDLLKPAKSSSTSSTVCFSLGGKCSYLSVFVTYKSEPVIIKY